MKAFTCILIWVCLILHGFLLADVHSRLNKLEQAAGQANAGSTRSKRDAKWDAQVAEFDKEMDSILKSGDYDRLLKVTLLPP